MNTSRARSFTAWQQSLDLAYRGHVQYGIRSYIQTRIMTAMQQLREGPQPAEISEVSWLPARPAPTEEVLVTCRITDAAGVQAAELLYSVAGGPPTIAAMFDDGRDVSFGRIPDGAANWEFLDVPTPGKSNVAPSAIEEETARQSFAPHTFRIESLSPNPARQATHLRLHIVKTGSYTVRIFDVIGREIRREQHEFVHGGMEELSLPLTDLKSGIYFVRVEGLRTAQAVKMIVLQ